MILLVEQLGQGELNNLLHFIHVLVLSSLGAKSRAVKCTVLANGSNEGAIWSLSLFVWNSFEYLYGQLSLLTSWLFV